MDERMRVSDADRDAVAGQLREHFAQGRLAPDELDERISATLGAKTVGDLRRAMADLPDSVVAPGGSGQRSPRSPRSPRPPRPRAIGHIRPRIMPLVLIALVAAIAFPGARWAALVFLKIAFVLWLAACLAAAAGIIRLRRRARSHWRHGHWHGGHGHGGHGHHHAHGGWRGAGWREPDWHGADWHGADWHGPDWRSGYWQRPETRG